MTPSLSAFRLIIMIEEIEEYSCTWVVTRNSQELGPGFCTATCLEDTT